MFENRGGASEESWQDQLRRHMPPSRNSELASEDAANATPVRSDESVDLTARARMDALRDTFQTHVAVPEMVAQIRQMEEDRRRAEQQLTTIRQSGGEISEPLGTLSFAARSITTPRPPAVVKQNGANSVLLSRESQLVCELLDLIHTYHEDLLRAEFRWGRGDSFLDKPPDEFFCSMTLHAFREPVVIEDGNTYERDWIESWFKSSGKSPLTNQRLGSRSVMKNNYLAKLMDAWPEKHMGIVEDTPSGEGAESRTDWLHRIVTHFKNKLRDEESPIYNKSFVNGEAAAARDHELPPEPRQPAPRPIEREFGSLMHHTREPTQHMETYTIMTNMGSAFTRQSEGPSQSREALIDRSIPPSDWRSWRPSASDTMPIIGSDARRAYEVSNGTAIVYDEVPAEDESAAAPGRVDYWRHILLQRRESELMRTVRGSPRRATRSDHEEHYSHSEGHYLSPHRFVLRDSDHPAVLSAAAEEDVANAG